MRTSSALVNHVATFLFLYGLIQFDLESCFRFYSSCFLQGVSLLADYSVRNIFVTLMTYYEVLNSNVICAMPNLAGLFSDSVYLKSFDSMLAQILTFSFETRKEFTNYVHIWIIFDIYNHFLICDEWSCWSSHSQFRS